jgi:two-component system sensor histidine kinase/response regulator
MTQITVDGPGDKDSIANIRHDLRTSVGHVLGYGEMLIDELTDRGLEGLVPDVQKIRSAGSRILDIVNGRLSDANLEPAGTAHRQATLSGDGIAVGEPPDASEISGEVGRLLIVDDNADNRDVLSRRLTNLGHSVDSAASGGEALILTEANEYDLILLDIMMPDMDGYEVLKTLKLSLSTAAIPVIMISALDDVASVVRCMEMGAADYLSKPFNPVLLRARIGAKLWDKRARDRETRYLSQLRESYARLVDLERMRDDLTNMIVHDLRTPLTSLLGGIRTIGMIGELSETQSEMIDLAINGGETLLGMINDLLDVEKMESGTPTLDLTRVDAALVVRDAINQISSIARSSNITVIENIAEPLPEFDADVDKLRRTLVNLVGNALKFSRPDGSVTISVDGALESLVRFRVSDKGEGIPETEFEHIFEKFGQVESRNAGRKMSTGLGLAFCKLTVEAHGGQIAVESILGQGSEFSFTLPTRPTIR